MLTIFQSARFATLFGAVICGVALSSNSHISASTYDSSLLHQWDEHTRSEAVVPRSASPFEWSKLTPTKDLRWVPCFDNFECARLMIPMDHHDPERKHGALAMIRKPSPLGPDHSDYRGPILFNPGGPGGSGIGWLISNGDSFAKILGPQFDLVSFDPRGVGASIPRVSFYKSSFQRLMMESTFRFTRDYNVAEQWARMKVVNAFARENDDGGLRYVNTDQTARDMLSIVHAHGREKLQYWGFSYGTVLGATFAAMFPDKVERLVIDGVVDAEDYYATLWSKNLMDTDKGVDAFISGCHVAGPTGCHFWAPTGADIRHNLTRLFNNIRSHPVAVTSPSAPHDVVSIDLLEDITFQALYQPYATFPILAEAYAALARGNGSVLLNLAGVTDMLTCPAESGTEIIGDAPAAILCNDGEEIPSDLESTLKYVDMMKTLSPNWSPFWAYIRMSCIDWPKFPKKNFRGPFNATTSYPLLVIGNTADPVTPIAGAKKMSAGFAHSVLLTQDSSGHCSYRSPSVCTQSHVRKYFIEGTLPASGTICPTDAPLFSSQNKVLAENARNVLRSLSAEDQAIYAAVQELSKKSAFIGLRQPIFRGNF
ncbi:TAP-like protein-domain-containing protein [Panaeolus papilionaceus]|nr:TAP-like protein-domain-containing protein [Panaeolus papilionaceus]